MRTRLSFLAALSLFGCPSSPEETDKADSGSDTATACEGDTCDADGDGVTVGDGDCDDDNADVNPSAVEACNELDDDCNGTVDDGVGTPWYSDQDGDGYGEPSTEYTTCEPPSGYVADGTDCDDAAPSAFPGNVEVCDDVDNNCDGQVDEGVVATFYTDGDGDGFGHIDAPVSGCEAPPGTSAESTDCDDTNPAVNPAAAELCNEIDDDCDGGADGDAVDAATYYADADADGFGNAGSSLSSCQPVEGYAAEANDCDDSNANVNPAAAETCNGTDDNCDGSVDDGAVDAAAWFADADGDTFGDVASVTVSCSQPAGTVSGPGDCDDTDASVNPAASETCNGVDENCNGTADDNATDASAWFPDADADGFGSGAPTVSCSAVAGAAVNNLDCDDTSAAVSPSAAETCNAVDDNCDGAVDVGATDATTWYADVDGDTFGDATSRSLSCSLPAGYVATGGDCDDTDGGAYPGATETCDGIDNNCNLTTDDVTTFLTTQAQADALVDCVELERVSLASASTVTKLDLPVLETVLDTVFIDGTTALLLVSMPTLTTVVGDVQVSRNSALTTLEVGGLTDVGGNFELNSNTAMDTVDVGSMSNVGGDTRLFGNSAWCVPSLGWAGLTSGSTTIAGNLCN